MGIMQNVGNVGNLVLICPIPMFMEAVSEALHNHDTASGLRISLEHGGINLAFLDVWVAEDALPGVQWALM